MSITLTVLYKWEVVGTQQHQPYFWQRGQPATKQKRVPVPSHLHVTPGEPGGWQGNKQNDFF